MRTRTKRIPLILGLIFVLLGVAGGVYVGSYYRAAPEAIALLGGSETVTVETIPQGWRLDGPGTGDALIFYPGGKVEATAYLPLLTALAEDGMDCFLVRMPLNLAVLTPNAAGSIQDGNAYDHWYVAGHSLGGACAALYAAKHADRLNGLILLAAYASKPLDEGLAVLELHGSEDGILDRQKLADCRKNLPASAVSEELPGGNHAQFGAYGPQKGDGTATVSRAEQTAWAVERIEGLIFGR